MLHFLMQTSQLGKTALLDLSHVFLKCLPSYKAMNVFKSCHVGIYFCITKTRPCDIQGFSMAVRMTILS